MLIGGRIMAFCSKCGAELKAKVKFCPECGNETEVAKKKTKEEEISKAVKKNIEKVLDTEDTTEEYTKKDVENNMGLAIISYLGILAFIPYFLGKNSKFAQYHAKQGMNLLILEAAYVIVYNLLCLIKVAKRITYYYGYAYASIRVTPWWIIAPMTIVGIAIGALAVIGIVYVCQGKAKELPVIGKLKIVK
jgi:uncharacterized Zn finger protein (UPF0148 family)